MKVIILKTNLSNQFHLGKNTLETTHQWIHSDTLFSALVNTYSKLFPNETDKFVKSFKDQKISISSVFHCIESSNGSRVFFLPKPISFHYQNEGNYKAAKAIEFFSVGVWNAAPKEDHLTDFHIIGNKHLLTKEELSSLGIQSRSHVRQLAESSLVEEVTYPKVKVHEISQEGVYYHQVNMQLQHLEIGNTKLQTHLYFLLNESLDTESLNKWKACLRLLADEGIGGERRSGCGQIAAIEEKDASDFYFPNLQNTGRQCSLSLGIPKSPKEFAQCEKYRLIIRGGGSLGRFGKNEKHRKQVRMIEEGAILTQPILGKLEDVHPDQHTSSVIRNGLVFSLPF